jgi:hypothetical protein
LNDDTILALGGFCNELLGAEAFKALVAMYEQQCAVDILNTQPHETKARDYIHASHQGFQSFLGLTRKFADAFNKLPQHQENQSDAPDQSEDDLDDPSVHDIYDGKN